MKNNFSSTTSRFSVSFRISFFRYPCAFRRVCVTAVYAFSLASLVTLSGCASETPSPSLSPTVLPSAEETPTSVTPASANPSEAMCNTVVPQDALYAFNPNLTPDPDYTPQPGTVLDQIRVLGGTNCAWRNATNGDLVEAGFVSPLTNSELSQHQTAAAASGKETTIPLPNVTAYFSRNNDVGEIQAFTGTTWVVARSKEFFSADDVVFLIETVTASGHLS